MPVPIEVFAVAVCEMTYFDQNPSEQVQPAELFGHV